MPNNDSNFVDFVEYRNGYRLDASRVGRKDKFSYVSHEKYNQNYLTGIYSMIVERGHTNKTKTEWMHCIWQYKESKYLFMQKCKICFIQEEIKTNLKERT